ncbi:MAG: hypothetical protein R2754_18840 [Microthrixaceae bacterium]
MEPWGSVGVHRREHLLEGGGGPVDVVHEPWRDCSVGGGGRVLEDAIQRIGTALGVGAVQVGSGDVAVAADGHVRRFGRGAVGPKLGVDVAVENLAHLCALDGSEESGEVPRQLERVGAQLGVTVLVVALVCGLGAVLIDEPFPAVNLVGERLR